MRSHTQFNGDALRKIDPKIQPPAQYLRAVECLDRFAHEPYGKRVIDPAVRWTLGQPGVSVALWGARHPEQLARSTMSPDGSWMLVACIPSIILFARWLLTL